MSNSNFTIISNDFLDRTDISLETMMVYIKIKRHIQKNNWEIKKEHIKKESGLGNKAFNRVWKELIDKELLISKCIRNSGKFNYIHTLNISKETDKSNKESKLFANENKEKNLIKEDQKIKKDKKINVDSNVDSVDSNGQRPLDGQISVEEALKEVEKEEINKIIQATGVTEQEAEEELRITKSKEGIKNIVQYTIGTINNKKRIEKELESQGSNRKQEINPLKFNNFEGREYDYSRLEAMLLGYEKYSEKDIHEVLGYEYQEQEEKILG